MVISVVVFGCNVHPSQTGFVVLCAVRAPGRRYRQGVVFFFVVSSFGFLIVSSFLDAFLSRFEHLCIRFSLELSGATLQDAPLSVSTPTQKGFFLCFFKAGNECDYGRQYGGKLLIISTGLSPRFKLVRLGRFW